MPSAKPTKFEQLKAYAELHWGLTLIKNNGGHGYWNGDWKSGYSLFGVFPGEKHTWRRFSTLKQVARALKYKEAIDAE